MKRNLENTSRSELSQSFTQSGRQSSQSKHQLHRQDLESTSSTDYSQLDGKLLQKEIALTRKNLKEAQARANLLTHENSQIQHQNNLLEQQANKADKRCKELIEKLSHEQLRNNEFSFLNKQLSSEIESLKNDTSDSTVRLKSNFDALKRRHESYVELNESKMAKILHSIKKCSALVGQNERLYSPKKLDFHGEIYQQEQGEMIQEILVNKTLRQLRRVFECQIAMIESEEMDPSKDQIEFDVIAELRESCRKKEAENEELKESVLELQSSLDKERLSVKDVLPRYKESLEKLKQNSQLMRDRITELMAEKATDKEDYEKKIRKQQTNIQQIEKERNELKEHVLRLTRVAEEVQEQVAESSREVQILKKQEKSLRNSLEQVIKEKESVIQENKMLIEEIEKIKDNYQREQINAKEKFQQEKNMQSQRDKQEQQLKGSRNKKKYDNSNEYDSFDENGNAKNDLDYYLNRSLSEVQQQNHREDKQMKQLSKPPLNQFKDKEQVENKRKRLNNGSSSSDEELNLTDSRRSNSSLSKRLDKNKQTNNKFNEGKNKGNDKRWTNSRNQIKEDNNKKQYQIHFKADKERMNYNDLTDQFDVDNDEDIREKSKLVTQLRNSSQHGSNSHVIEDEIHMLDDEIDQIQLCLAQELQFLGKNTPNQLFNQSK